MTYGGVKGPLDEKEINSDTRECFVQNLRIGCQLAWYCLHIVICVDKYDACCWFV